MQRFPLHGGGYQPPHYYTTILLKSSKLRRLKRVMATRACVLQTTIIGKSDFCVNVEMDFSKSTSSMKHTCPIAKSAAVGGGCCCCGTKAASLPARC